MVKVKQRRCARCGSKEVVESYDGKMHSLVCNRCGHNWLPRK